MAQKQFKAESQRLLELMINSIYTNKEIFLRELISNASDALDKRYYEGLKGEVPSVTKGELSILIEADKENRTLTITDTGIGMDETELENNLGTIARSGSLEFQKKLEEGDTDAIDIIGQFGVGFYSAFMVSKSIRVESKSAKGSNAMAWESDGKDGYVIEPCNKEEIGTKIILSLKDDSDEEDYSVYLEQYKIQSLIKKYSDYVRYPINMDVTKSIPDPSEEGKMIETTELETLNSMVPIWKKRKAEISDEEYNEFYKAKFNDWEDPQKVIHYQVEGNVSYTALLFIPAKAPYNFYNGDFESGLQLYSKGVFIMDKQKDLLPECYRFVTGLVDSNDLSLNISREILQQDRQVQAIAKNIEKKIHGTLIDMLEHDREEYEKFFNNFGLNLKFDIYKSYGLNKEKLQDLLLYRSSFNDSYVTLKEYKERMKEDQKEIYYASGASIEEIKKSPALKRVQDKGFEILYFTDSIDEFVITMMQNFEEKPFKSVTASDLDLESEDEKEERKEKAEENKDLLSAMKESLKDDVVDVRLSGRLVEDPVCLVAEEGLSIEMEKVLSQNPDNNGMKAKKVLEINPNHEIFTTLKKVYEKDPNEMETYASVLYDQACLIEGLPIENPADYANKIVELMIKANN